MIAVAGIFSDREALELGLQALRAHNIGDDRVVVLLPGSADEYVEQTVPIINSDEPGTVQKIASSAGRGVGIVGGIMLGGALGGAFLPGVGAVLTAGVLAAALLGTAGAAFGAAAGNAIDEKAAENLRHDELHLYEAALRQGRSVVIAILPDNLVAQSVRQAWANAGAESVEEARETWWRELRSAEEAAYTSEGRDFALDEDLFRRGFEAALHPRFRGLTFLEAGNLLQTYFAQERQTDAFRRGYERGRLYHQQLMKRFPPE